VPEEDSLHQYIE
jgi:SIT4 phosphatase-associated protein